MVLHEIDLHLQKTECCNCKSLTSCQIIEQELTSCQTDNWPGGKKNA